MRSLILAVTILGATASVVDATPAAPPAKTKSRAVAVSISLGTTLAGAAMLLSRDARPLGGLVLFIGPTTGRWYAGEATISGIGIRSLAVLGTLGIFFALFADESCDSDTPNCDNHAEIAVLVGGGAVWAGSSVVDIVLADRAARDYNARQLTLAPMRVQTPSGGATGIALTGRF